MRVLVLAGLLVLAGCTQPKNAPIQVIVGATLLGADNQPAVEHSVVVVADGKIQAAGRQQDVPVPRDSAKINGLGFTLVMEAPGESVVAGKPADLLLKKGNTVERRMKAGRWVDEK